MKPEKLGAKKYVSVESLIPLMLLCLFAFFKTAGIVLFDTKVPTDFLTSFQGEQIPVVLFSQSVLLLVLGAFLLFLKERNDETPAYVLAGAGALTLVLNVIETHAKTPVLNTVLMVWQEGFRLSIEVCFWITALRFGLFSKKASLLILVFFCQIFGALFSVCLIRLSIVSDSTATLLPFSSLFIFASALCVDLLAKNGSVPFSRELLFAGGFSNKSSMERRSSRLKNTLYLTAFLITFAGGFFNWDFWKTSVIHYAADDIGLLKMFADISLASCFLWTGLIGFAVLRKNSLLKLSFLFFIPAAFALAASSPLFNIFALMITAKVLYDTLSYHFKESVFQIFPHIISKRIAFKISLVRKFFTEPAALGLAGITLYVLERAEKTQQVVPVILAGAAIVITCLLLYLKSSYVKNACLTLKQRLWRGGTVMISGHRLKKQLQRDLCSSDADSAIYALRVLENAQYFSLMKKLEQALSHERKKVREFALERLEKLNFTPALPAVKLCALQDPSRRVRCRAVRVMCHLGTSLEENDALTMLHNPDLREGALIGLLSEKAEGMFAAIAFINELSISPVTEDRALVARVIGEVGNPDFYRPLLPLLNDMAVEVRKEALDAAGKLLHTALLPSVLSAFYTPYLRETAAQTLMAYGETAFPETEYELRTLRNPIQYRNLLIKTINQINIPAANDFLFDNLSITDRRIRFMILRFLCQKAYKPSGKNQNKIRLYLYDEIEWITSLLAALEVLCEENEYSSLNSLKTLIHAVEVETDYARERIVLLLGLLHPSKKILKLTNSVNLSKEQERKSCLTLIEELLSDELKMLCKPLFEDLSVSERLAVLRPHFTPPVMPFFDRLISFLHLPSGDGSEWLKSCAIYVLGHIKDRRCVDSLLLLLRDPDPVIRETTVWALGNILTNDEVVSMLSGCVYDPFLPAARMARFMLNKTRKLAV